MSQNEFGTVQNDLMELLENWLGKDHQVTQVVGVILKIIYDLLGRDWKHAEGMTEDTAALERAVRHAVEQADTDCVKQLRDAVTSDFLLALGTFLVSGQSHLTKFIQCQFKLQSQQEAQNAMVTCFVGAIFQYFQTGDIVKVLTNFLMCLFSNAGGGGNGGGGNGGGGANPPSGYTPREVKRC